MQFGMFLEFGLREKGNHSAALAEGMRLVEAGEALGADVAWLSEFHFSGDRSILSSPATVAGAIAGRTTRMRIGTAVYVLPLSHPLRIAEEIATLDQLSGGRIELGVGRSGFTNFYRGYGIDYGESQARFDEALTVLRKAWTGEPVSHRGEFYQFDCGPVVPSPVQRPHPPLRMAATGAETFVKVGQAGLPIFVGLRGDDLSALRHNLVSYRQAWRDAGHPGNGSALLRLPVFAAKTQELALSRPRDSITYYFDRQSQMVAKDAAARASEEGAQRTELAQRLSNLSYDDILNHRVAFGAGPELVQRLSELREVLGIDGILGEMNAGGGLSEDDVLQSLRIITEEVMPCLR